MFSEAWESYGIFYVKVLYTIDIALQHHWKSCCELNDHQEVNDFFSVDKIEF